MMPRDPYQQLCTISDLIEQKYPRGATTIAIAADLAHHPNGVRKVMIRLCRDGFLVRRPAGIPSSRAHVYFVTRR